MSEICLPHHELAVEAMLGPLHLKASVSLKTPWTVIFGPSGSGKSSILQAICGLIPKAKVDFIRYSSGPKYPSPDTLPRSHGMSLNQWPPHHRGLGYAPQHAALFPHLSAEGNIRFPSQVTSGRAKNSPLVDDVIELFDLHSLVHRMPAQLSGGERRRVALARAFAVPGCRLMLLDEPFTGLDRALRDELLPRMQAWLAAQKIPVLSVTHDVDETLLLNAEVIRLADGHIIAQGPAREVLAVEREHLLQAIR